MEILKEGTSSFYDVSSEICPDYLFRIRLVSYKEFVLVFKELKGSGNFSVGAVDPSYVFHNSAIAFLDENSAKEFAEIYCKTSNKADEYRITKAKNKYSQKYYKVFTKFGDAYASETYVSYIGLDESLTEDLENLEKVDADTVMNVTMGTAKEESKTLWQRLEDAEKIPEDAPLFGAEDQPVPEEVEEPKVTLDESLFNEGISASYFGKLAAKAAEAIEDFQDAFTGLPYDFEGIIQDTEIMDLERAVEVLYQVQGRARDLMENVSNTRQDESLFEDKEQYVGAELDIEPKSKDRAELALGLLGNTIRKISTLRSSWVPEYMYNLEDDSKVNRIADFALFLNKALEGALDELDKIKAQSEKNESLNKKSNKRLNEQVIKVTDIDWDTDGEDVDLPTDVEISIDELDIPFDELEIDPNNLEEDDAFIIEDEISEYLSDTYGWLVNDYHYEINESLNESTASLQERAIGIKNFSSDIGKIVYALEWYASNISTNLDNDKYADHFDSPEKLKKAADVSIKALGRLNALMSQKMGYNISGGGDFLDTSITKKPAALSDRISDLRNLLAEHASSLIVSSPDPRVKNNDRLKNEVSELVKGLRSSLGSLAAEVSRIRQGETKGLFSKKFKEDLEVDSENAPLEDDDVELSDEVINDILDDVKGVFDECEFTTDEVVDKIFDCIADESKVEFAQGILDSMEEGEEELTESVDTFEDSLAVIKKYFNGRKASEVIDTIFTNNPAVDSDKLEDIAIKLGQFLDDYLDECKLAENFI